MFDTTVSLGNILTMASFFIAIVIYVVSGLSSTKVLDARLQMIDAQMEDFKTEMRKLAEVVVQQAITTGRLDRLEERQLAEGKRLDSISETIRNILIKEAPSHR